MAVLLKLFEQIVQAAAQDASSGATCEQPAQPAFHEVTQSAAALGSVDVDRLSAGRYASIRWRWRRSGGGFRAGETFNRLVGEQTEDRHGDRRHSSAAAIWLSVRVTLTMRSILHPVEDIDQAHVSPPLKAGIMSYGMTLR